MTPDTLPRPRFSITLSRHGKPCRYEAEALSLPSGFFRFVRQLCSLTLITVGAAWSASAAPKPADESPKVSTVLTPEGNRLVVDVQGLPPPAPLFFSATVEQTLRCGVNEILGEARVKLHVVQGKPEVLTLGLSGDGEVFDVSGKGLRDWSVRQTAEVNSPPIAHGKVAPASLPPFFPPKRLLDLRPILSAGGTDPQELEVVVRTRLRQPVLPGSFAVLIVTPGESVGFASKVTVKSDLTVDLALTSATGMVPLGNADLSRDELQLFATGEGRIEIKMTPRGAAFAEAELTGAQLFGKLTEPGGSVDFRLRGQLRSQKIGARLRVLSGHAALSEKAVGEGWHVELVTLKDKTLAYDLVADREGALAVDLPFAAEVRENGDWKTLDFFMPAGAVVPLQLEGLGAGVSFKTDAPIVPAASAQGWQGFLPADGAAALAWKRTRVTAEGALFFTSYEQSEVRIGAGLLRQTVQLGFRVLQGKLNGVQCRVEGPGEILGVEGTHVVGWKLRPEGAGRTLEVRFSRPVEAEGELLIHTQTELGAFPVKAEPMRLIPEGVVRHSGFVRVANDGAVRLEVADVSGMMQLAPAQFPGQAAEAGARQIFVYRFPSATYDYHVVASQIQPEVGISEIATYELAETDRALNASLELDIREAPLRDWSLQIPEDYTVVAVTGSEVSDYLAETQTADGYRALKILFSKAIEGRQLLQLRLEKNQSAGAGEWTLRPLRFPGAKSVRGHIGAVSTPGYRIVPAKVERLVEVPLSYFPKQIAGLQQAWRLRESEWAAAVRIEALGQSVQADVFHLYSIKEGVVYGSVLLNYFVVGAPATEWRIAVPQSVGNIDVVGQNVRRDWRRDGDQVVVSLHQPVLGAATLLITFEQPMSARGGSIKPGEVRPLGVQAERGYIQVVSPLQVKHDIRSAEGGLLKLEPMELPTEYRLLSSSPSLAAYQYTARPFNLEMGVEWYTPGETIDQVVDFAQLSSQVSRDGQVVTDARYFVKTRGRKALRLVLPAGVKLWEARVDNEATNARIDGDQTLIPLPARLNPNEPVAVTLRLGQAVGQSGARIALVAPRTSSPTVINEWTLHSDAGRLLVPRGGNAEMVYPGLTETGFEWLSARGRVAVVAVLGAAALAALCFQLRSGAGVALGLMFGLIASAGGLFFCVEAAVHCRPNLRDLTYAATMVPTNETVSLQLDNLSDWRAMLVTWGLMVAAAGAGLVGLSFVRMRRARAAAALAGGIAVPVGIDRILPIGGVMLLAVGLLAQRGGAAPFFLAFAGCVFCFLFVPAILGWLRDRRAPRDLPPETPGSAAQSIVPMLAIIGLAGGVLSGGASVRLDAANVPISWIQEGVRPAQSLVQTWTIRDDRLYAEAELTVRGGPGDRFLLLRPPALLTDFKGDGLRISKVERDGQMVYFVTPEREGVLTGHARFEMPVPDRAEGVHLPTGPAATQRVTLELDQGGWAFTSPAAVQIVPTPGLGENRSGATLILGPQGVSVIQLQPKHRDVAAEATQFFAETANLYVPGPGVVNGLTRITIRPVQGRVSEIDVDVPKGLTVGDVVRGPLGAWRFDPEKRRLHVSVEPAQTEAFKFDVETQLGTGALPFDLGLEPLRVAGASGEVGMIAIGFAGDAQPEGVRTTDLSTVNVQDFDPTLLSRGRDEHASPTIQNVWRYGQTGGRVDLKIAPVAAEVRVAARQVLSLDDDRMVMAVDLNVAITRVGLFKLSFVLPEGLEVEALSGPALSHWTETQEGKQRVITMHLNGRTIGDQSFALTLTGAAPRAQEAWPVPRVNVREATRQTGEALVVPGKGLRLRAVEREKVTQLDPRSVGGMQPGTLAFRLLQEDWVLRLGIEALEPWVTVQTLQEVTVREGQTLTRLALRYRVENAAVKQFRIKLPGLSEDRARTVRATGSAVTDMVKVAGETDLWEIRFQRGIAGETDVQIEFQGVAAREQDRETLNTPVVVGARQSVQFVAVRAGGRLELEAGTLPRGWTRVDWSAVPPLLQDRSDRTVPALCFRVAEPEGGLAVTVRRHEVAEALKLRVTQGDLTTLFAASGASLTAVELKIDVLEKSTLSVRLPAGARLFNTFVNGESVSVVREGDAYLFHVAPNSEGNRSAAVRLVYSATGEGKGAVDLFGPSLNVPLENVTWRVVVPPGYDLDRYHGGLRLRDELAAAGSFSIEQYQSLVTSRRSAEAKKAVALLQEANTLLERGDQQKAGEVLSRASNAQGLDEASNEDARVQLRNLKTQQTVLGLNTRRQRLYLDNRVDAARNEQLEQAANLNPFMQGKVNFDPQQVDQLLMGNTVEENAALRGIATRLVDQQLSAEPAPGALDVTLPERGRVLTFTRSLQVDGTAPLELKLDVSKIQSTSVLFSAFVLLAIGAIAAGAKAAQKV